VKGRKQKNEGNRSKIGILSAVIIFILYVRELFKREMDIMP
jgi:hypothetical protein